MTPQEQIKERLDLVDLISGYIQLKSAGGGSLKGLCPFHTEKTPSFNVSKDKQFWHCFGCNIGGDHFEFLMRIEGIDFAEALRMLAERTGVEIPRFDTRQANDKTRLLEITRLTEKFFAKMLSDSPSAAHARAYVQKRVISPALQEKFAIGYAPDSWEALSGFLLKRGYKEDEIARAGVCGKRDKQSGIYDRFRNRLMFPIHDTNGKTVGFTGRVLVPDVKEAKYVNTPQSELYDKSAVLYGLDLAKPSIREKGFVVLVEGQMDVVGSWRGGVENVVASSGTALTERQVGLLKRHTNLACIAFDADAAGLAAARRGIDLLLGAEMDVKIITLPKGIKDPDELTLKDAGLWLQAVAEAKHIVAFEMEKAREQNLQDPLVKKRAVANVLQDIAKLKDAVEQDDWLQRLSKEFNIDLDALKVSIGKKLPARPVAKVQKVEPKINAAPIYSGHDQMSELAVSLMLDSRTDREYLISEVSPEMISSTFRGLYTNLVTYYTSLPSAASSAIYEWLQTNGQLDNPTRELLTRAALISERDIPASNPDAQKTFFLDFVKRFKEQYSKARRLELETRIRSAEAEGNQQLVAELMKEFTDLLF
ncbi:MAG: DNA primase [bacterium]